MKHITDKQIKELEQILLEEKDRLELDLGGRGKQTKDGDWMATPPEVDTSEEDYTVQADRYEEFFNRGGAISALETRLVQVKKALARISEGTYGLSEVSGKEISLNRLMANPAATTTIEEANTEEAINLKSRRGGIFDESDSFDGADEE